MRTFILFSAIVVAAALALSACAARSGAPSNAPPARSSERRATLMFFADAHGQLEAHPELFWGEDGTTTTAPAGGYARLAHVANAIRRETRGAALLIDGGDTFQGSGPAAWSEGEVMVEPQRALGVDVAVPGNWDVVHGPTRMRQLFEAVGHPWIAANVFDAESGEPVLPPTWVKDVGGIRIGFVGLTDPDVPRRQSPAYSRGLRYDDAASIAPHVRALREHDGADVVVLLAHLGLDRTLALVEQVPGIDVALSSDTHERVAEPIRSGDTLVVEPGAFASFLGRLDVTIDGPAGRPRFDWELIALRADRFPEDPEVARVVRAALAPYAERADRVIGHTSRPLERYGVVETSADAVLADAIRAAAGTEIALSNGFRFGSTIPPGPITESDLWNLFPVTTRLRVGTVTGAQLRAFFEEEIDHVFPDDPTRLFGGWMPRVSGLHVRFRTDRPRGDRLVSIEVDGAPLEDDRRYSLAACEREGDEEDTLCRIRGVTDARTLPIDVHQAVRRYLAEHDPIGAAGPRRVVAEDLPARVFSQHLRR